MRRQVVGDEVDLAVTALRRHDLIQDMRMESSALDYSTN
jgi:hypothetical protein